MAPRLSLLALFGLFLPLGTTPAWAQETGTASSEAGLSQAAPQLARPFLYRIEGKGTTAFLYGTVHLPDKRVVTLPESVEGALDDSSVFYAEIEATTASEAKVQKLATMTDGTRLNTLVGPEAWARIEARFIKAGQPAAMANLMAGFEPWAFSSILPMLEYLDEMATQPALDKMLYMRSIAAGKRVGGLETVEEQVAVFETFTREEQVQMLKDSLDLLDEYEASQRNPMEEMITAWMSGDGATLVELLDDGFGKDPALRERAEAELLWKRNVRFAERMERLMTESPKETMFFAIGALHLPDAKKVPNARQTQDASGTSAAAKLGVVKLMRRRGYTVTRYAGAAKKAAAAGK